ncbi:unnamed protein product [Cladocopium goreaui]|uniref:Hsp70-Hsp90 organising protein (PfHOP) (Stress-inducible protein 1) n=1 Tax=Cladocopium goreaui TaxID=2562237 RepID=A0A9P1M6D3_9DINO|nr:unnamed protein product [Cladocopium goreaui]
MAKDVSSASESEEEEEDKESLDDKMKRITKLGKEGNVNALVKEAKLADCSDDMMRFASQKAKDLGNMAFQKREYEQALEYYAGALLGDVLEKHKIYSNRSACLFQLGKYTEALKEATEAIKLNRAWSKGYFRAGRAALEMEFYQEALEMFEKGLEKEPSNKDLVAWAQKARDIRNQHQQEKLVKKHTTDYSKFDSLVQQQKDEEDEEEAANDPNRIILGDKYYSSSKMEQRQLKAMLGYKEPPPPPFEPKFDMEVIYRHDNRGEKTQHPIWDPTTREWRIDAKPAPSRVDYSDSQQAQAIALFLERQSDVQYADELLNMLDQHATPIETFVQAVRDVVGQLMGATNADGTRQKHNMLGNDARWLFVGIGCGLPLLTAARYLPTSDIVANTAHRAAYIADLCMTIARENGLKSQQVKFVHRPSHELAVVDPDGEDENNLTGRVDVVVLDYELFDPGFIGKGVLARVNHVKKKLCTTDHMIVPMGAQILCAPCEIRCPRGEGPDGFDWRVVLETGLAPDRASRPNGIDTVVKYQIRIHNNMSSSDVDVQAEFSKFVRFEDGAVVAPEDVEIFERSGDLVGALSFHPPNGDVRFPLEETYYWFSLSGPCPNMKNGEKSSSNCSKYQKGLVPEKKSQYVAGGLCKPKLFSSDIPDGTPGCSYYIENYTTKNLDEIAGITQEDCGGRKCSSWSDFRLHCSNQNLSFTHLGVKYCKEYDYPGCITSCQDAACGSGEVGIPFWTGRCNASRNALRASLLERAFGGSQVPSFYGSNPRCDQYSPMCNKPAPDAGVSYCHRDDSGVCDACHIPGTVRAVSPPSQVACRVDLFLNKELPQYKDFLPQCDTECGGECSTETPSSACCVYIGKCKRTWKAESWGSCNASCGNGTRFRQVWCPFEEIFGPCDESSKPENSTKCRGDACPWSKDHFGNWSQCNNTCGAGSEVQGLICECPDHCPGKEKECAKSPKPKAPSRPCFNSTSKDEFCSSCAADTQCSNCTKGFDLKDGTCHGSKRLALVNYELRAFNLSDAWDGWLSSAFVPAFKDTIQKTTNASLDVLNLS